MSDLLDAATIEALKADVELVIQSNPTSVTLRRKDATLAAQTVLLAAARSQARVITSVEAEQARSRILILGTTDLDIARDDRFNVNGRLYHVVAVKPDYPVCIQAEAVLVE
jgi:hypothetical protein